MSAARRLIRAVARRERAAAPAVEFVYRCASCGNITRSRKNLGMLLTMRHRTPQSQSQEFCQSTTFVREQHGNTRPVRKST